MSTNCTQHTTAAAACPSPDIHSDQTRKVMTCDDVAAELAPGIPDVSEAKIREAVSVIIDEIVANLLAGEEVRLDDDIICSLSEDQPIEAVQALMR